MYPKIHNLGSEEGNGLVGKALATSMRSRVCIPSTPVSIVWAQRPPIILASGEVERGHRWNKPIMETWVQ